MARYNPRFLYALIVAVFNIVLAILFSKSGYEAFIATTVALGIFLTALIVRTTNQILKLKLSIIVKLLCLPVAASTWFFVITAVMLTLSEGLNNTAVSVPSIDWRLLLLGAVPYLLPQLNSIRSESSLKYLALRIVTIIYSTSVLLMAAIASNNSDSFSNNISMVLAVQLLYLMNFAALKTNYLSWSLVFANKLTDKLKLSDTRLGYYILAVVVGLPFFLPVAIVIASSTYAN